MNLNIDELNKGASKSNVDSLEVYGEDYLNSCLDKSKIDVNAKYHGNKFILYFLEENSYKCPVMSLGNISATIGGAKSKKTFFSTMLSSAFVTSDNFAFRGNLDSRKLLYIDTEQSQYHVQKVAKRINSLNGSDTDLFDILALREHPEPELRTAIIEYILRSNPNKYSMVIIDGLVDLINDFNDISESSLIVNKIMSWSSKFNCHINCIIHTNKNKNHARGHLGSALMNKSETIFRVSKQDGDISIVECEASRNAGFRSVEFYIDDNGLPIRSSYPSGHFDNSPNKKDSLPF